MCPARELNPTHDIAQMLTGNKGPGEATGGTPVVGSDGISGI